MKNKLWKHVSMLGLVCMVVMMASCSRSEYKNAIPADAPVVMELDVKDVIKKSDFLAHKGEIADAIESIDDDPALQQIAEMLRGTDDFGLDFFSPMYVYLLPSLDDGCFLASVRNRSEFVEKMTSLSNLVKFKESDGISWLYYDDAVLGAVTKRHLLIGSANDKDVYRDLLEQSGDECFFASEAGKFMNSKAGDLTLSVNMDAMPREIFRMIEREIDDFVDPESIEWVKKSQVICNLEFSAGEIALNAFVSNIPEDQFTMPSKKISEEVFSYLPTNDLVGLIAMAIDPQTSNVDLIKETLEKEFRGEERVMLNQIFDILEDVNGTGVVSVSGNDIENNPELLCILPTAKENVASFVYDMNNMWGVDIQELGVNIDGDDNYTSITNATDYNFAPSAKFEYASSAKTAYVYAYLDIDPFVDMAFDEMIRYASYAKRKTYEKIKAMLDEADYMELKVEEMAEASLALVLKSDNKNSLELLLELFIDALKM
jgi:hypothetical protein